MPATVAYEVVVNDEYVQTAIGDTIDSISDGIHDMFEDDEPEPAPTPRPRPAPRPTPDTDNKQRCDSEPKSSRFQYQPLDGTGRSQGATALICPSDYKPVGAKRDTSTKVDVYGFPDPAQNKDLNGDPIFHRSHILGDKMGGDWV